MKWRLAFPLCLVLLGTDSCVPTSPEADPVLASDAETVARLRADHGETIDFIEILMLTDDPSKSGEMQLAPDGLFFQHLSTAAFAVPGGESLLAANLRGAKGGFEGCQADSHFVYALEVSARSRPRRRPEPVQLELAICVDGDKGKGEASDKLPVLEALKMPVALTSGPKGTKVEQLGHLAAINLLLLVDSIDGYMEDFEVEQHRILGERFGCPSETTFEHGPKDWNAGSVTSHWCMTSGVRHGPFAQGDLDVHFKGVRRVEGRYDRGTRDGHWVVRDESGQVTEESWWSKGTKVAAPDAPR